MDELVCGFSYLFYLVLQALLPLLQVVHEGYGKEQSCYQLDFIHCEILRVAGYACDFSEAKGLY